MDNNITTCSVNNKYCNVNNFKYNKKTKELWVDYKLIGWKEYKNFSLESYNKLLEKNSKNETLGTLLKQELKK